MPTQRLILGPILLCAMACLITGSTHAANDEPPPIPYGTLEVVKLNAIVDAAPFMAASTDRVVTLKQERLRACQQIVVYAFEQITAGRTNRLGTLVEPMRELSAAWMSLCTTSEQKMPMLEFALQTAEQREKMTQAMFDAGQASAAEALAAKRDRLTAEIEMIECQRAISSASVR